MEMMIGWSIDTVAMCIAVLQEKVLQLRVLLEEWKGGGRLAPIQEVRPSSGKLLHLSNSAAGKVFVRQVLNQWGFEPFKQGWGGGRHVCR